MPDSEVVGFSVVAFGQITLGTIVLLIMQVTKGLFPGLQGRNAEIAVMLVSAVAVGLALWGLDANWYDDKTYLAFIIGWLSTSLIARSAYSMLFHQAIPGLPAASDERIVSVTTAPADETATKRSIVVHDG